MSWSGNNVPIYFYKMNVIFCHSCPVKRGQSLKAQLSLEMSHPGKAETDLIWQLLQGKVPTLCPALILDGAKHTTQQVLTPQAVQVRRPVLRD